MFKSLLTFISLISLFSGCKEASELLHKAVIPQNHNYTTSNSALLKCNIDKAINIAKEKQNSLLKNSELGLGEYFKYNSLKSNNYLDNAISIYRNHENRAIFDISTFLRKEHQEEGYDKVLLHNYKAINYLLIGDAEAARVEAKNSNFIQEKEQKKLNQFKKQNRKNSNSHLLSRYEKLFNRVDPQHNPYQNPFAYYISALAYAEDQDYDNALVDIEQALKLFSHADILKKKLKSYQNEKREKYVELFFDVGQAPIKSQVKLELDMGNGEKRMAYLPSFSLSISDVDYIKIINSKEEEVTRSSLLADINAIKINEFKEKLPTILYLISKQAAISLSSNSLDKKSKLIGGLFKAYSSIYGQNNIGTWSFLPQKILVASFSPKDNETYEMVIITKSGDILEKKPLNLKDIHQTTSIYKHFTIRSNKICNLTYN